MGLSAGFDLLEAPGLVLLLVLAMTIAAVDRAFRVGYPSSAQSGMVHADQEVLIERHFTG